MKNDTRFTGYTSYIMQAYVDWLESAGARVVPLVNGASEAETRATLSGLNGVLFPGGDGNYSAYGRLVFNLVKEINDEGTYMPIWGTCAG